MHIEDKYIENEPVSNSDDEPKKLARETEEFVEWQEKGWETGKEYENAAPEIKQDVRTAVDEAYQIEQEINEAVRNGKGGELSHEEILDTAGAHEPEEDEVQNIEDLSHRLSEEHGLKDQDLFDLHEKIYGEKTEVEEVQPEIEAEAQQETAEPPRERSAQEIGAERLERWTNAVKGFFRKGAGIFAPGILARNGYRATKESIVNGAENMRLLTNEKLESFATAGKIWRFRNEMESLTKEQGPAIQKMQQGHDLIEKIRAMSPEAQERKEFQALYREAERMVDEGRTEVNKLQGKLEQSKKLWMEFLGQDTNMSVAITGIKARKASRGARA